MPSPNTLAKSSVALTLAFLILFSVWLAYVRLTPMPRPTFFSDPLQAWLILVAAAAAIAGGAAGVMAIVKRERTFGVLVSVLVGCVVLYWTIAEMRGH